jgi:hypothetical protein
LTHTVSVCLYVMVCSLFEMLICLLAPINRSAQLNMLGWLVARSFAWLLARLLNDDDADDGDYDYDDDDDDDDLLLLAIPVALFGVL